MEIALGVVSPIAFPIEGFLCCQATKQIGGGALEVVVGALALCSLRKRINLFLHTISPARRRYRLVFP